MFYSDSIFFGETLQAMENVRIAEPHHPLKCHHIVRYGGKQSLFIKHMLKFKEHNLSNEHLDLKQFYGCKLCLDCAYKLFIKSNALKLFERLCLNPNPITCLHIVCQIIMHPQIYHFIARNKQSFTSFLKLTMATMYTLMDANIPKGGMLYQWQTILHILLSLCVKSYHLRWIMRLKQTKFDDKFGNNLWNSFIIIPFGTFIKQTYQRQRLDPRAVYGNWIALNIY